VGVVAVLAAAGVVRRCDLGASRRLAGEHLPEHDFLAYMSGGAMANRPVMSFGGSFSP